MRPTSLPIAEFPAASSRGGLGALFVMALLASSFSSTTASAMDHLTLLPQVEKWVLAQRQPPSKKKTTKAAEPEVDPALKRDKTALPPDYKIPPDKLPDIDINKEIPVPTAMDPKNVEYQEWKKSKDYDVWRKHKLLMDSQYKSLLGKGSFTDARAEREILRYGIKYKLALMTQRRILFPTDEDREKIKQAQEEAKRPVAPDTIDSLRDDLLKDLYKTNAFNGQFEIRDAFLEILCEEAPKLLDNNYYVRFNVAVILSTINNRDRDLTKNIPDDVPCFKATKALLELVNDPQQHPTYKIHPVQALARICRNKNCTTDDRFAIIETLIKQMGLAKTLPEWYGLRLAESLSQLGDPNDRTRKPVVVDALVRVLKDPAYTFAVRAQAAHSLGRVPLEGFGKVDEIAIDMLRLGEQMAVEYEKSKDNPLWKKHFTNVYLGFQPQNAIERNEKKGLLVQVDSKPTLAASKTIVTEAYQHYLPLAQNVVGGRAAAPIPDQLRKIKVWLDAKTKAAGPGVAAQRN